MTVGSLFAGIGGFDLGFERAGFEIRWQVDIDDYAGRVLAKHWPAVLRYGDIRAIDWSTVEPVDVVCGGFPCQPHSIAGRRGGSQDDRDLWPEFVRCVRGIRPRWVVAENVPGLLSSDAGWFFGTVLSDLAASGYDAEWDCLPASAFGAPHRRDRIWIVAYPSECTPQFDGRLERMDGTAATSEGRENQWQRIWDAADSGGAHVADTDHQSQSGRTFNASARASLQELIRRDEWWKSEPDVGRVAHGVSARVDRLKGLGNSIVPQIAEWIAKRILEAESCDTGYSMNGAGRGVGRKVTER